MTITKIGKGQTYIVGSFPHLMWSGTILSLSRLWKVMKVYNNPEHNSKKRCKEAQLKIN